jgi:hypothetical protein
MRHSSPVMTLGTYAKAVTADKRHAQDAIAALFVGKVDNADVSHNPFSRNDHLGRFLDYLTFAPKIHS